MLLLTSEQVTSWRTPVTTRYTSWRSSPLVCGTTRLVTVNRSLTPALLRYRPGRQLETGMYNLLALICLCSICNYSVAGLNSARAGTAASGFGPGDLESAHHLQNKGVRCWAVPLIACSFRQSGLGPSWKWLYGYIFKVMLTRLQFRECTIQLLLSTATTRCTGLIVSV